MTNINAQMIKLGKQTHVYHYGQTMDRLMSDYYIKKFIMEFLNSTLWDTVPEDVKEVCYKGYLNCKLPIWDLTTP